MIEQQETNAPVAAPDAAPAAATPPTKTVDDLASLLSEFETATAKPPPQQSPTVETPAPTANPQVPTAPDLAGTMDALDLAVKNSFSNDALKSQFEILNQSVRGLYEHQRQQQDHQDFTKLVGDAEKMLKDAGYAVGTDYAKRWLTAELAMDGQLRELLDNRYASPEHLRRASKQIGRAMERLLNSAKMEPDPVVTADRYAVAAAVRGTSTRMPEKPPPRYSEMTESEFAAEKRKHGV